MHNGNGTNGHLSWWILGIFGAFLTLGAVMIFAKLDKLDARLAFMEQGGRVSIIENSLARTQEQMKQVDELVRLTRLEQVERTQRFSDLSNRISLLEQVVRAALPAKSQPSWP